MYIYNRNINAEYFNNYSIVFRKSTNTKQKEVKIMKKTFGTLLIVVLLVTVSFAQDNNSSTQASKKGKIGLGLDGTNSPNLAIKYFFNNNIAMEVLAGFNLFSPGGDAAVGQTKVTGSDIRAGLALLYHFSGSEFVPYVGVDVMYETNKSGGFYTTEPDAKNSVIANLMVGGEYFPAKQFSVGIKEKLGVNVQLSRDIPKEESDLYLKTATELTLRYYFN
jgi:outer membrane protein W